MGQGSRPASPQRATTDHHRFGFEWHMGIAPFPRPAPDEETPAQPATPDEHLEKLADDPAPDLL